jgi:murein DD-endopeptidase MepM/ murein hydrolase activator NlpD
VRARVITAIASLLMLAPGVNLAAPEEPGPQLYLEVPGRVAVGQPLDVFVSSSVPAAFTLVYGEERVEAVDQDLRVSFDGRPGRVVLSVEAVDVEGRRQETRSVVMGLLPPKPVLSAPERVTVGDPLTVRLAWTRTAEEGVEASGVPLALIADAWVEIDGRILDAYALDGGLLALAAVPLAGQPGTRHLRGVVVDEFGTWHRVDASLEVRPNPHPVQLLSIPASILAVSTDDGRRMEAEALAQAFAAVPPDPRWRAPFMLPIIGRGTSGFGLPRRYGPGGNVSYHLGADIAAPEGTPIHATNEGVVRVAGQYPIKGGLVVLDHGFGVTSLYFHQSRIAVQVGDVVERGDVIGYVGTTGLSTGPHLHWEMRIDGVPTDPMAWVDRHYPVPLAGAP